MPTYTFTVRKKECEISLTTSDRNAIEQQIAIWVLALSRKPLVESIPPDTVEEQLCVNTPAEKEPIINEFNNPVEPDFVEPKSQPEIKPFFPEKIETFSEPSQINFEETKEEYVQEFINNIEPEVVEQTPTPASEPILTETFLQKSIEQPVQETLNENYGGAQKQLDDNAVTLNTLFNAEAPTKIDFESILEKTVDNINTETSNVVKKDENFCKLVKANNITDRLELLLFTADYFCKYDARFVFSLKQINGKLMNNLAVIVDHGILKIALDNNYLEREGESEYRLTEYGRSEIYSKAGIWS